MMFPERTDVDLQELRETLAKQQAKQNQFLLDAYGDYWITDAGENIISLAQERHRRSHILAQYTPPKDAA